MILARSSTAGVAAFIVFVALFVILTAFVIRFARQLGRRATESEAERSRPASPEDRADEG